jgi:hypothetical protein
MLGKTYLFNKQWSKAVNEFAKLMKSPYHYKLVDNYSDLFKVDNGNNSESVFSLQFIMKAGLGNHYDMRYGGRSTHSSAWTNSFASWALYSSYTKKNGDSIDMSDIPQKKDFTNEIKYGNTLIKWYQQKFKNVDPRLKANVILPGATFVGNNSTVYKLYWPFSAHANDDPPAYRTNWPSQAIVPWRKFVVTGNKNQLRWDAPANVPFIRYASVLLMYAEAKNEADGPSADVLNAVNKVRERAGIVDLPSGLSKNKLRRDIRLERLHELAGSGHLYFDVRRWKTASTNDSVLGLNKDVLDFRGEKVFHRVFTKKNYLWPIPHQAIEINDKLKQNPGW